MRLPRLSVVLLAVVALAATTGFGSAGNPSWTVFDTGVTARLRGLDAVSARVAWASGSGGTVLRTIDGGRTWQQVGPPGAGDLQFRDIEAFDADHAVIMAAGTDARFYVTDDGGRTWVETFRNEEPQAFYDCIAFFDRWRGLALSDPVDGRFRVLSTVDGGRSWRVLPAAGMPPALDGEFAFAASGTCLVTADRGRDDAWIASGGGTTARVFHSRDGGQSWRVVGTAVPSGPTAGIFSLAFEDPRHGIIVGGDFTVPTAAPDAAAWSRDGGHTWTLATAEPGEYRSGSAWLPRTGRTAVAVGPTGSDITRNGGRTWTRFDTGSFDTVDCAPDGACWASGESGRVGRLTRVH